MGKGGEGRIHTPAQVRSQGAGSRSSSRGGGGGTSAWRPRRRAPCTMAWMWHAADGVGWPPRTAGRRPRWGSPKEVEGCLRGVSTLCWQRGKTSWRKLRARGRRRFYKIHRQASTATPATGLYGAKEPKQQHCWLTANSVDLVPPPNMPCQYLLA